MAASFDHGLAARQLFGRNMRRLRRERGLTQEALFHESGLMQSYLSEVEAAKRNVSIDSMATIAAALGVSIGALFDEAAAAADARRGRVPRK